MKVLSGQEYRDIGINASVQNADNTNQNWSTHAYNFLLKYIKEHKEFMAEDVRLASEGKIDQPPSKRAWGAIILKAVKSNLIRRKGFRNVKNPYAHCTPATLWEVII